MVRYLLDEHIPKWMRRALLRLQSDLEVCCVGDPQAPPLAASDPELLGWCERYEFVLVTNNRKSMPRHLKDHLTLGGHVPGIIAVDPTADLNELIDDLVLIAGASLPGELQDVIRYLPIG